MVEVLGTLSCPTRLHISNVGHINIVCEDIVIRLQVAKWKYNVPPICGHHYQKVR